MDELQLIQGLKDKNDNAVKALVNGYMAKLYNYSCKLVKDKVEAEDIVITSLTDVARKLSEGLLEIEISLDAFLFTMVKRKSLNSNKARVRYQDNIQIYAAFQTEEEVLRTHEAQSYIYDKFYKELETLPDGEKQVLKMLLEGLTLAKIAEIRGVALSTVKNQRTDALKKLRIRFSDDDWMVILILLSCGTFVIN